MAGSRRILIVNGHPDPAGGHFDHALAQAYAEAAEAAGHSVRHLAIARLDIPVLRNKHDFENDSPPADIRDAQQALLESDHLVLVYPLWLGTMPGLLKLFLEQTLRPGFAFDYTERGLPKKRLTGRSARVVVSMGMPALAYRWFYGAHSLKSLKRNILGFCGMAPVRTTLIGRVEALTDAARSAQLERVRALGRAGR